MAHDKSRGSFDGAAWFERQVRCRTREALCERGSEASTHSTEYRAEYARQMLLFRAERAAIKKRKAEIYAERLKKKMIPKLETKNEVNPI